MQEGSCKVSVIVPTYNRASLLPENADSILNQDSSDYELIYVDDGSADDTPAVLARYEASSKGRVKMVRVNNGGPGKARNIGARRAKGRFLLFTDDDAAAPQNWISGMLAGYEASGCEVLCGGIAPHSLKTPAERYLHYRMQTRLGSKARRICVSPAGNLLIPSELFWQVGGFCEEPLPAAEDWELSHRLTAHRARILYDPAVSVVHRYQTDLASARARMRATGAAGVYVARRPHYNVAAYVAYSVARCLLSPLWVPRHYPADLYFLAVRMEWVLCLSRVKACFQP